MIISGINFAEIERPAKWIKFPIDFFEQPIIKKLRRHAGGDSYTILYQKVMLYSARWGGLLPVKYEKSLLDELALILDESERDLNALLSFLEANALLSEEAPSVYLLTQVPQMIGKDGESAERVKRFRERKKLALGIDPQEEKKAPKTSAERVRDYRKNKKELALPQPKENRCNAAVAESVTPCNESVTNEALHETNIFVTRNGNVTEYALHVTHIGEHEMVEKPKEYGYLECNDKCNVTRNVTETLHVTDETPLRYKREDKENIRGEYARAYTPSHENNLGAPEISGSPVPLHGVTEALVREYIEFRLNGEGIKNPVAFESAIRRQISDPSSEETGRLREWQMLQTKRPKPLEDLVRDFASFGGGDRKVCLEIASSYREDYSVDISPVLFEVAYAEANRLISERSRAV